MVAIKSAPMPCGVKPVAALVAGSCAHAPPSEPMGTRDMLSTPPATTKSSQPLATFCAAMFTASRPEAQKRLICTPDTRKSQPALSKAVLGKTEPCSPTGDTQPITTSSTSAGSKSWRACSWFSNPPSKSTGLTLCKLPSFLPLPRGVRTASKIMAWVMGHLLVLLEDDNLVKMNAWLASNPHALNPRLRFKQNLRQSQDLKFLKNSGRLSLRSNSSPEAVSPKVQG